MLCEKQNDWPWFELCTLLNYCGMVIHNRSSCQQWELTWELYKQRCLTKSAIKAQVIQHLFQGWSMSPEATHKLSQIFRSQLWCHDLKQCTDSMDESWLTPNYTAWTSTKLWKSLNHAITQQYKWGCGYVLKQPKRTRFTQSNESVQCMAYSSQKTSSAICFEPILATEVEFQHICSPLVTCHFSIAEGCWQPCYIMSHGKEKSVMLSEQTNG